MASSRDLPQILSQRLIGPGEKLVGRCFRRDAENNTPEASAPQFPTVAEATNHFFHRLGICSGTVLRSSVNAKSGWAGSGGGTKRL
ncbi:MAG TPA: hypothetical protein DCE44_09370 [Verrucomicrobiales bacterium]|nr:hypothetical protein [Verrucomicrobiales bacterium]